MRITTITGASGMLGQRVARILASRGHKLTLCDVVPPPPALASLPNATVVTGNLSETLDRAFTPETTAVVHLAAVVSAAAEAEFDLGYDVNVRDLLAVLERLRALGTRPKFVFASSSAAYGPSERVDDDTYPQPQTSYGHQKVIGEYLTNDFSRKGMIDGVSLRLPTVCVRPGKPNRAATGFFSGILREPLAGQPSVLPVSEAQSVWINSPNSTSESICHSLEVPQEAYGRWRTLILPGVKVTVGDQLEALERAKPGASALVERKPDAAIDAIVSTIPANFSAAKALSLGFPAAPDLDGIIQEHIALTATEEAAAVVGDGYRSEPVSGIARSRLVAALLHQIDHPHAFHDDSVKSSVRPAAGPAFDEGALWRKLQVGAEATPVQQHCYADGDAGEVRIVELKDPKRAKEGPLEVVHAVVADGDDLRIEVFQRNRLNGKRVHWEEPAASAAFSIATTVRLARLAEEEAADTCNFRSGS